MHEDTHTDHKLSSLTVVKMMFAHDSLYFHACGIVPANEINKNISSSVIVDWVFGMRNRLAT